MKTLRSFITCLVFLMLGGSTLSVFGGTVPTDSLRAAINSLPDDREKADALLQCAVDYFSANQYDSTVAYCKRTADLSARIGYREGLADAWYRLSMVYKYIPDYSLAQEYMEQYLQLAGELKDSLRLAKGYYQQSALYRQASKDELALSACKHSLDLFLKIGDTRYLHAIYNNLGSIYKGLSQFDSSAAYYLKGITVSENSGDSASLETIFNNLGDMYQVSEDPESAREYYQKALAIALQLENNEDDLALIYNNFGRLSAEEGKYLEALEYYDKAAEYYKLANQPNELLNLYNNYGDVFFRQKKFDLALKYFDMALEGYMNSGWLTGIVTALGNKASVYIEQGRYSASLSLLDSTYRMVIKEGSLDLLVDVLGNIADAYKQIGNYQKAYEYLERQYVLRDSLVNLFQTEVTKDLMFKYQKEQDQAMIKTLENDALLQKIDIDRRTRQRDGFLYAGLAILALAAFLVLYFRQKALKDRIIARQKIQQLEEEKKLMVARLIVEGQEEERKRIARELHDGLGVLLSATKMQFTSIKDVSPENMPLIEKATQLLEQATGDVRKISHNMMPGLLTKLGLYEAVEDLFENLNDTEDLEARCEIIGDTESRLPENKEIMIYRIIQELVNNSLKHSEARLISIKIKIFTGQLVIKFHDDGKGFNVDEKLKAESGSFGLKSIQSRVSFLEGQMDIRSGPGQGTECTINIPI